MGCLTLICSIAALDERNVLDVIGLLAISIFCFKTMYMLLIKLATM